MGILQDFDLLKLDIENIRRRIWNKHILLWWYRLWIRRDEFHVSLNTDVDALRVMDEKEIEEYYSDLARRKKISHRRDCPEAIK
jgi:hypothetical protein